MTNAFARLNAFLGEAAIPHKRRTDIVQRFRIARMNQTPEKTYLHVFYSALLVALVGSAVLVFFTGYGNAPLLTKVIVYIFLSMALFGGMLLLGKFFIKQVIDARIYGIVRDMEDQLPEYLAEVSLNLKSGQDLEDAISNAAQEDFGELSEAMKHVSTRIDLGFDMEGTIREFMSSYQSDLIDESFELILISWKKGAQTPKLVDRVVDNMKDMRNLREKIVASVANYKIFLGTVTVALAPAMMALSFYIIALVRDITTEVMQVTQNSVLPITVNAVRFQNADFIWFSVLAVIIISMSTSFIISYINSGDIKGDTKQLAIYIILSLVSYGFFMLVFRNFFKLFSV